MIVPTQCKMARAALGWSVRDLADRAQLGRVTVNRFETGKGEANRSTLAAIRRAFEDAGIVFTERGVELRDQPTREEAILPSRRPVRGWRPPAAAGRLPSSPGPGPARRASSTAARTGATPRSRRWWRPATRRTRRPR